MSDEITIRKAETPADYRACQEVQRRAWGIADQGYIVPIATLVGAQLHGGLVLGAFLPDGQAVGISFGFLGRVGGLLCLYSQLTGIVPEFQDRGIGARLKTAQREFARQEGLPCIAWAFDPLQAGNARFNLEKLGATAGHYIVDMYGPRTDALNAGATTDRLIAEWETTNAFKPSFKTTLPLQFPFIVEAGADSGVCVHESAAASDAILLEIPSDISALRAHRPQAANSWQLAVRQGFLAAFGAGHRAVGFVRSQTDGNPRCFYLLRRQPEKHARQES